jgi:hypothetical protein
MVISLSKHVPNKLRKLNEEVAQFSTIQKLQARKHRHGLRNVVANLTECAGALLG